MEQDSTTQEQSSTQENLTRVCFSCSAKLSQKLRELELSGLPSTHGEGGSLSLMLRIDTQQHYCDTCSKNMTDQSMPTADYYTLLTELGTDWPV